MKEPKLFDMTIWNDYIGRVQRDQRLMMKIIPITEFKAHALHVLSELAAHKEPVLITKRGKPLAQVVPYTEKNPTAGRLSIALVFEKDIVSPLGEEMWDACR